MESLADFLERASLQGPSPLPSVGLRRVSIRELTRGILSSQEYRQSVVDRIKLGTIPAAVELVWYYYAEGKPTERVEIKDVTDDVDEMDAQACEREAERLTELARALRLESESSLEHSVH